MRTPYQQLSYGTIHDFKYGTSPHPIALKNGMTIGGGDVYPEINFTLPPMIIESSTFQHVVAQYREMVTGVLKRAHELHAPGIVVEIELLPPMTMNPKWGIEITKVVRDIMAEYEQTKGLRSVMRLTPNDTREHTRPPKMRSGELWDAMMETFEGGAKAYADFLSVESTGGKEVHDDALINANLAQSVFALGVMGARDMEYLWSHIVDIANRNGVIAVGDSACGFGNTAMVLADRGMIPKIFAAVVRVATVSRALVAFEVGAKGPSKDCAYEGPYLKAITGSPISMEGKSSACAHLSPVGNIVAGVADLWSNESVQNIKLLGEMAPTVSMEQLIYDCRLFNQATKEGPDAARLLQKLLVDSDSKLDPQAYVLRPDVVFNISKKIVSVNDPYLRTKIAAQCAIDALKEAYAKGNVDLISREIRYLNTMQAQLDDLPDDAEAAWAVMKNELDVRKFIPADYLLG